MSPSTMTTFELRRKVDCLAEQMYFLRAQKKHFEDEIKVHLPLPLHFSYPLFTRFAGRAQRLP